MSVLEDKLKPLVGQQLVVVMTDNRAFRGTLMEFDHQTLVLRDVVEALPNNAAGWEEPTVSTGMVHKVVTWNGVFSHDDNRSEIVRLKDAIIQIHGVLRIWEYSLKNVEKPEHVEVGEPAGPRHGQRISRRP
jgi:small nuclear ribonucleoprotein (snRNP)-like protein